MYIYKEDTEKLNNEIQNLTEQCRILNQVMEKGYMDTALFIENQNLIMHKLTEARRNKIKISARQRHRKELVKTEEIIWLINNREGLLKEFEEDLFNKSVQNIQISIQHDITFSLINGLKLTEENILDGGEMNAVAHANRL